jgi:glycine oxidase
MSRAGSAAEVVVLGGGIAGWTVAWQLLRRGHSVRLVAGQQPAASAVAAGMLAPMPETSINPPLGRLGAEALRAYPEFLESLAEDTGMRTGFERSGVLRVAYRSSEAEALREQVGAYEAAGMPSRWLDRGACAREVAGIGDEGLSGGLLSYEEAQVQPEWLLAALKDAFGSRGGSPVEAEVLGITPNRGSVTVTVVNGAVQQQLSADVAVLALGSWSGAVAGVTLPVRPVKGQLLVFPGGAGPERIVYWGHNYLLTKPDGSVIVGATMEEAGFSIVTDQHAQELRPVLEQMWPGLAEAPATARAGLRPASPDGLPISGWLPGGDVYAFTAHFRNGFLLSPLAARLAANEIGGGGDEELLRGLRPGRFEQSSARRP